MLTSWVLAGTLIYAAPQGTTHDYTLKATFDGFLPILGGNTGVVETNMTVRVDGLTTGGESLKAASEITAFDIAFNGAKLPLGLESVQEFFPRTTIEFSPAGKISKTNAPDLTLPVRLPGLDAKRFPDITYVPIEFDAKTAEVAQEWTFERIFDGAPMVYRCRLESLTATHAVVSVNIAQELSYLENEALEVVKEEKDAYSRVKAKLTGSGQVIFEREAGAVARVVMTNDSVSQVTNIKSGESIERKLKTTFVVDRKGAKLPEAGVAQVQVREVSIWDQVRSTASTAPALASVWWQKIKPNLAMNAQEAWQRTFRWAMELWQRVGPGA